MTGKEMIDKIEDKKYTIMYYIYFLSCLGVALMMAKPANIISSLI